MLRASRVVARANRFFAESTAKKAPHLLIYIHTAEGDTGRGRGRGRGQAALLQAPGCCTAATVTSPSCSQLLPSHHRCVAGAGACQVQALPRRNTWCCIKSLGAALSHPGVALNTGRCTGRCSIDAAPAERERGLLSIDRCDSWRAAFGDQWRRAVRRHVTSHQDVPAQGKYSCIYISEPGGGGGGGTFLLWGRAFRRTTLGVRCARGEAARGLI